MAGGGSDPGGAHQVCAPAFHGRTGGLVGTGDVACRRLEALGPLDPVGERVVVVERLLHVASPGCELLVQGLVVSGQIFSPRLLPPDFIGVSSETCLALAMFFKNLPELLGPVGSGAGFVVGGGADLELQD